MASRMQIGQEAQQIERAHPGHVLRYLRGTSEYGLWYRQMDEVKLHGFMDADWEGSPTDRKSTLGGLFSIGSTTISWYSRKRRSMALSSAEAE